MYMYTRHYPQTPSILATNRTVVYMTIEYANAIIRGLCHTLVISRYMAKKL